MVFLAASEDKENVPPEFLRSKLSNGKISSSRVNEGLYKTTTINKPYRGRILSEKQSPDSSQVKRIELPETQSSCTTATSTTTSDYVDFQSELAPHPIPRTIHKSLSSSPHQQQRVPKSQSIQQQQSQPQKQQRKKMVLMR